MKNPYIVILVLKIIYFSQIAIPYACKLMLQEFQAMSIAPRIISETSYKRCSYRFNFTGDEKEGIFKNTDSNTKIDIPPKLINFFIKSKKKIKLLKIQIFQTILLMKMIALLNCGEL